MRRGVASLLAVALCTTVANPQTSEEERGKDVFQACASCHNTLTDARKSGPSLRTLFGKVRLRNGKRTNEDNVAALIADGFNGMPSYRYLLRQEDRDYLLAYLKTLRARPDIGSVLTVVRGPDGEILASGEKTFTAECGACHRRGALPAAEAPLVARSGDGHSGSNAVLDNATLFSLVAYIKAAPLPFSGPE